MTYVYATGQSLPKMLLKIQIAFGIFTLSLCVEARAQSADTLSVTAKAGKLSIGDLLPPSIWHTPLPTLNYRKDTLTLAAHKGKIIVLDFWATYCSSCLKSMPKLDSLQQEFPDQFFALLVNPLGTRDDAAKITATLGKQATVHLPTLYQDAVLTPLFDIRGVPTLIWIDEHGGVLAITNRRSISSAFVRHLLNHR